MKKNGNIIDLLYSLSIVITSVQYYYDNVSATINEGEMIAIIGTSGAGKSTLLNILELLDTQSDGDYILDGLNIKESSKKDLSKLRNKYFGFVVQHFALIKDYTVYENIEIPLEYARIKKKDRKENKQEGYGYFN